MSSLSTAMRHQAHLVSTRVKAPSAAAAAKAAAVEADGSKQIEQEGEAAPRLDSQAVRTASRHHDCPRPSLMAK